MKEKSKEKERDKGKKKKGRKKEEAKRVAALAMLSRFGGRREEKRDGKGE